ncbi:hypothetical protein QTP70_007030 [Hemibagrus guttatus]|uniref:Reverse transcriptase domain-containing protein n=1 Tax=Hemibagrus guttatus TaxID=175788 RepID=A0AAE0QM98_9TELE|nr:hypothetical protein QTP70_007030 [Hemibagrus guttatus]KAK3558044.1 hypothetical protein QTP86_006415 [Hemibagrus guttatus]
MNHSRARANLKRGIRKANYAHKLRIEEHFHSNSDPRRMWKGIQTITDHKPSIPSLPTSNAFFPNDLNQFFACFDKGIIHHTRNTDSSMVVYQYHSPQQSSAFNAVVPSKLITKLSDLGICTSMHFLTNRSQSVRLGNHIYSTLILNKGVPPGCVLSPLLYSLFTHDCVLQHNSNIFIKYADDTTVGRISNNNESAYREEIQSLSELCSMNNVSLNAMKTKELIVDFWKSNNSRHSPIYINVSEVERVSSFKFLGVHISEHLSWHQNASTLVRKAQQHLYFLRRLKKVHLSPKILSNIYRCIIESIMTSSITVWYGISTVCEKKSLQSVVKTAQ